MSTDSSSPAAAPPAGDSSSLTDTLPPAGTHNFHFGPLGALLPVLVFLGGMIALAIAGTLSSATGGAVAFASFVTVFLLLKDRRHFQTIVVRGLRNDMLVILLVAFLLAGVLAETMKIGGLVDALIGAAAATSLPSWLVPVLLFLFTAVIGLATGTSAGTVITALPILLPFAIALGVPPGLAIGAIVGGAMWGDNIAPVSDTTIASALTQNASVARVVKARLRYAGVAGVLALIGYVVLGFLMTDAGAAGAGDAGSGANPLAFLLLIAPAVIIVLMLRGADIVLALTVAAAASVVVAGLVPAGEVFAKEGLIVAGFTSTLAIFPFFIFLFCLIEALRFAGTIAWIGDQAEKRARTPRSAELMSAGVVAVTYLAVTVHAISVVVSGPVVRSIMARFNVDRARGANIIDCVASGLHGIAPHSGGTIIVLGLVAGTEWVPAGFSAFDFVPFVLPSIFLLLVVFAAILTGWGRKPETGTAEVESAVA